MSPTVPLPASLLPQLCPPQALPVLVLSAHEDSTLMAWGATGKAPEPQARLVTAAHTLMPLGPQFSHLSKREDNLALSAFGGGVR